MNMKNNEQKINVVFQYLVHSDEGSPEFETFMALLRGLKDYSSLLDHYGFEFIQLLWKEVLPKVEETYNKALVIETLVEATYGNANKEMLNELFDEYILLIEQYATGLDNAARCLNGFIASGIDVSEISINVGKLKDQTYAIALLAYLNAHSWGNLPEDLQSEVKAAREIRERTYIFAQFLVILNPLIAKYQKVSSIDFVFDYEGAHIDWPFAEEGSSLLWIERGIINDREGHIFEELARVIHNESIDLQSRQVLSLYERLFEGRDPLDVIFTVPSGG